jgi:Arc/MetJ-type ribon-helix-helix transcriptional regulator
MKANNNNDGERITLRLEDEDLELIDAFIDTHPEFSSRSHLARRAIRLLIKGEAKRAEEEVETPQKRNTITVEIPSAIFDIMEDSKRRGEYTSYQSMVEELVRERFLVRETSTALNAEVQQRSARAITKSFEIM